MEPAMFSVASMFGSESGDDDDDDGFVDRDHAFPGLVLNESCVRDILFSSQNSELAPDVVFGSDDQAFQPLIRVLRIREFAFHRVNANLLWPGASIFAEWIIEHEELVKGRHVLELGSGTGALAIFLKKTLELDITTSDYDDPEIENNIRSNCHLNNLATLPHIRHTWGEDFPYAKPDWDLIIASDILLYVKQYPDLIQTLCFLLKCYNLKSEQSSRQPAFVTEPYRGDIQTDHRSLSSCREIQGPDSVGTASISGAVSGSLKNSCDGFQLDAAKQALTLNMKLQGKSLPWPCFLMSWRRRIPKEEESLFFEGCRTAQLFVTDFGARIYCIHLPL